MPFSAVAKAFENWRRWLVSKALIWHHSQRLLPSKCCLAYCSKGFYKLFLDVFLHLWTEPIWNGQDFGTFPNSNLNGFQAPPQYWWRWWSMDCEQQLWSVTISRLWTLSELSSSLQTWSDQYVNTLFPVDHSSSPTPLSYHHMILSHEKSKPQHGQIYRQKRAVDESPWCSK